MHSVSEQPEPFLSYSLLKMAPLSVTKRKSVPDSLKSESMGVEVGRTVSPFSGSNL